MHAKIVKGKLFHWKWRMNIFFTFTIWAPQHYLSAITSHFSVGIGLIDTHFLVGNTNCNAFHENLRSIVCVAAVDTVCQPCAVHDKRREWGIC